MQAVLDDTSRTILDSTQWAVVATLNPGGEPQTSMVWIRRDGDALQFSCTRDRQKVRNVLRDPRVSLTVFDPADPYRTVDIRGYAEVSDDTGNAFQRSITHQYLGQEPPPDPQGTVRVIVRIVPRRVHVFELGPAARLGGGSQAALSR